MCDLQVSVSVPKPFSIFTPWTWLRNTKNWHSGSDVSSAMKVRDALISPSSYNSDCRHHQASLNVSDVQAPVGNAMAICLQKLGFSSSIAKGSHLRAPLYLAALVSLLPRALKSVEPYNSMRIKQHRPWQTITVHTSGR